MSPKDLKPPYNYLAGLIFLFVVCAGAMLIYFSLSHPERFDGIRLGVIGIAMINMTILSNGVFPKLKTTHHSFGIAWAAILIVRIGLGIATDQVIGSAALATDDPYMTTVVLARTGLDLLLMGLVLPIMIPRNGLLEEKLSRLTYLGLLASGIFYPLIESFLIAMHFFGRHQESILFENLWCGVFFMWIGILMIFWLVLGSRVDYDKILAEHIQQTSLNR